MECPAGLSPEVSAWIQAQIAMSNASNAATLRAEINKVDDWANGVFLALKDVLAVLLKKDPALARAVAPNWLEAAQDFDLIDLQGKAPKEDEPLELLEARKMLYRVFSVLGIWAAAEQQKPLQSVPRARRA